MKLPLMPPAPPPVGDWHMVFDDDFDGPLDRRRWSPFYLPHWRLLPPEPARHRIDNSSLVLTIEPDQAPWCPEFDGEIRVSALQSGHFSGAVGSVTGQHRFRPDLLVRRDWPDEHLFTLHHGALGIRARCRLGPSDLASLYLIGFEERPEDSGEITVFEIFGRAVDADSAVVGRGVKAINDPRLVTDFIEDRLPINVADWHDYGFVWTTDGVQFFVDGQPVGRTDQSPDYPLQLMLTCYRLETTAEAPPRLEVDCVRAWEAAR